mmetsp:Transcript_35657/g.63044  ORF Transcript_35657/g.63044 Transcript_35657/m.63044 type:complete len:521 (+) Transcript_35657:155-1717(+)
MSSEEPSNPFAKDDPQLPVIDSESTTPSDGLSEDPVLSNQEAQPTAGDAHHDASTPLQISEIQSQLDTARTSAMNEESQPAVAVAQIAALAADVNFEVPLSPLLEEQQALKYNSSPKSPLLEEQEPLKYSRSPSPQEDAQFKLEDARHPIPSEKLQPPSITPQKIGSSMTRQSMEAKRMREEFDERRQWLTEQANLKAASLTADASLLNIPAESALNVQQKKQEAWRVLQKAMGVDEAGTKRDACETWIMGLVNLSYLLVIVGCEIDLYGFIMAWSSYWHMGRVELQMLLVACPIGYFLATAMYMAYNQKVIQSMEEGSSQKESSMEAGAPSRVRLTAREPIKVQYYHFMPIVRYYLVIKDREAADIEGLFRVNSLSSFSLGIAQICGILYQVFLEGEGPSVFVKINIGSQILNWFITLMYFTTPVAGRMKSAIKVDALIHNSNQEMRRQYESYMELTALYAKNATEENLASLRHLEDTIDREISEFCKAPLNLSDFDMKTKFTALRLIRRKQYNAYAKI